MDFDQFWASQPCFDSFPPEGAPVPPHWCATSRELATWCLHLVDTLCEDPLPTKVDYAKARLLDNFCRSVLKASPEHRAETNLDNHPCLHQVLLTAWNELENTELRRAVPELSPPAPVVPLATLSPEREDQAYAEQETGIIIGIGAGEDEEP